MILCILGILGFLIILYQTKILINRFLPYFTPARDLQLLYGNQKRDTWALITGASEGIGKEWAIQLSQKGFNIILISRSYEKLEQVSKSLSPNVQFKIITADFTKCIEKNFFENLVAQFSQLEISILINNVGVIDVEEYINIPEQLIRSHLTVNMFTPALLIRHLYQRMYEDAKKNNRRATIVNMSSCAQEFPNPYYNIYSSSKAFLQYLCTSLQLEKKNGLVDFITFRPYFIQTAMVNFKNPPLTITTQKFVRSCLGVLGKTSDSSGTVIHEVFSYIQGLQPLFLQELINPIVSKQAMYDLGFKKK